MGQPIKPGKDKIYPETKIDIKKTTFYLRDGSAYTPPPIPVKEKEISHDLPKRASEALTRLSYFRAPEKTWELEKEITGIIAKLTTCPSGGR